MKAITDIIDFRGVKFGEVQDPSKKLRPLRTDNLGILWMDIMAEDSIIGVTRVAEIKYGFYKNKFLVGMVKFGGEETYEILRTALVEKYGKGTEISNGLSWKVGNVSVVITFIPASQVYQGELLYQYLPLEAELRENQSKKEKEEMRMRINAAKVDL